MSLRTGSGEWELFGGDEWRSRVRVFASLEEALSWLRSLEPGPDFSNRLRKFLGDETGLPVGLLSDDDLFHEAAWMLYRSRLKALSHSGARRQATGQAAPVPSKPIPTPPPPSRQSSSSSSAPQPSDPDTFPSDLDVQQQAAALASASDTGKPFCAT